MGEATDEGAARGAEETGAGGSGLGGGRLLHGGVFHATKLGARWGSRYLLLLICMRRGRWRRVCAFVFVIARRTIPPLRRHLDRASPGDGRSPAEGRASGEISSSSPGPRASAEGFSCAGRIDPSATWPAGARPLRSRGNGVGAPLPSTGHGGRARGEGRCPRGGAPPYPRRGSSGAAGAAVYFSCRTGRGGSARG